MAKKRLNASIVQQLLLIQRLTINTASACIAMLNFNAINALKFSKQKLPCDAISVNFVDSSNKNTLVNLNQWILIINTVFDFEFRAHSPSIKE